MTASRVEQELRDYARLQVRAGLLSAEEMRREVAEAVAAEMPSVDADLMARAWLAAAAQQLAADQRSWPAVTDHDRLEEAFATVEAAGIVVLRGCEDHWAAKAVIDTQRPRGVAWFTPADVWHAIDHGMLELNLWHGDTANVAAGDGLLDEVLGALAQAGLEAHFDEGRVEIAAVWQARH